MTHLSLSQSKQTLRDECRLSRAWCKTIVTNGSLFTKQDITVVHQALGMKFLLLKSLMMIYELCSVY